eukprot:181762-Prymnesium_polylepis.1
MTQIHKARSLTLAGRSCPARRPAGARQPSGRGRGKFAVDTGEEGVNTGYVNTCLTAGVNTYQHLPKSGVTTSCTNGNAKYMYANTQVERHNAKTGDWDTSAQTDATI